MGADSVIWDASPVDLAADPIATIGLDRAAWEALGARFDELDDGDGEHPGLATATVITGKKRQSVGILDYGAEATYLLVPGSGARRLKTAESIIGALAGAGALNPEQDLIDLGVDAAYLANPQAESGFAPSASDSGAGRKMTPLLQELLAHYTSAGAKSRVKRASGSRAGRTSQAKPKTSAKAKTTKRPTVRASKLGDLADQTAPLGGSSVSYKPGISIRTDVKVLSEPPTNPKSKRQGLRDAARRAR